MSHFAQPVLGRRQFVLISTTLDDVIPEGHDVRILDELLQTQDWSAWEAEYCLVRGQPPIAPCRRPAEFGRFGRDGYGK